MFNLLSYAEKWQNQIGWCCIAFIYAGGWEMELFHGQLIKAGVWPFDFWTPLRLASVKWLTENPGDMGVDDNLVKKKHFTDTCSCCSSFNLSTGIFRGSSNLPPVCPGSCCPLVRCGTVGTRGVPIGISGALDLDHEPVDVLPVVSVVFCKTPDSKLLFF